MRMRLVWIGVLVSSAAVLLTAFAAPSRLVDQSPPVAAKIDPYQVTTLCTAYPVNIGRRVSVSNGVELQAALDSATAGDTILLAAGATFTPPGSDGSFVLRNRHVPQGQWILVRSASSAFDDRGALQAHTRVSSASAALMPQIRANRVNAPAIKAESGARGYRLIGLDVGPDTSLQQLVNLIELGGGADVSADTEPSDIVIDRCYLHGNDSGNFRRGVLMNGVRLAVIDSYLANFHDSSGDSQALGGSNGPGPFKIVNNYLEAASENILFGGSDPAIPNLVPSDIEVRLNLSTKRLSWKTEKVPVKNAFELKNARRVIVEANTFEHVWVSGQDGTAILLKSVNQDGHCPWCVTEYVTFQHNIVRGAANGVVINATETGQRGVAQPVPANHIRFANVLFEDLGSAQWGGGGKLLRVFGGVSDASFTHLTSRSNPNGILDPAGPSDVNPNFVFSFNIVERQLYGIGAGGDEGIKTLARNFSPYTYQQNVLVNTSAETGQAIADGSLEARYPPTTWVARGWTGVGFQANSSKLAKNSRFAAAGADGRDTGADVGAITAMQTGARRGDGCGPTAVPR
jgi:hypothetical protein